MPQHRGFSSWRPGTEQLSPHRLKLIVSLNLLLSWYLVRAGGLGMKRDLESCGSGACQI